jgi:GIY-YIG catalytic domain
LKTYVTKQLQHIPGGTRQFDRLMLAAKSAFDSLLLHDEISCDEIPPYLYTHLQEMVDRSVKIQMEKLKSDFYKVLLRDLISTGFHNIPTLDCLLEASSSSPLSYDLTSVQQLQQQPNDSFQEQQFAREQISISISQYTAANGICPKCPVLVGDPGAGKTTVMTLALLHSICKGLNVYATTIMAERAQQLGVLHVAELFCIPVIRGGTPSRIAETALARIYQTPWKYQLLKTIDVLGFDEFGAVPAELISVMDIILRRSRSSGCFMGGLLLIPTMDAMQLYPVDGIHPLLSSHTITCFLYLKLQHSVRAAQDASLQRIQKITRLFPQQLDDNIKEEFLQLVSTKFTFIDSLHSPKIPRNATYVFGKKEPGRKLLQELTTRIRNNHNYCISKSTDEQSTRESGWTLATAYTKKCLNRFCKEPSELLLYVGGLYQVTFNAPGKFSQSQLAMLLELPNLTLLQNYKPFDIWVAPPGCKTIPPQSASEQTLMDHNWKKCKMTKAPLRSRYISDRLNGRRHQYGLKMFTTSTIHAVMGQTCSAIVTQVSASDPLYALWQREQIIVLLSRTSFACDVYFNGNPVETANALWEVLCRTSQFAEYIAHLLDNLIVRTNSSQCENSLQPLPVPRINFNLHPFRNIDVTIPSDTSGYVYILVSKREPSITYIGQTDDLTQRLRAHYAGRAAKQTSIEHLRPWGLLGFVAGFGFDHNGQDRKAFEAQWKRKRDAAPTNLNADMVARLAEQVILERQQRDTTESLRFVQAGTLGIDIT